ILAEIGLDMTRFGSAERLAALAGLSPGNNESAGKRRKGRTRRGNRYLRRVLVQCAWTTRKTSTFLGGTFCRLQARVGGKQAAMAVAHKAISGKALTLLEWACSEDPPGMRTPTLCVRSDHVHAPCHVGQPAVAQSITNCRSPPRGIPHDRPHTARL